MGRTCYSGPVYGAKRALASFYAASIAAEATVAEIGEILIPATEDWYLTEVHAYCTDEGNGATIDVECPNGTSLLAADLALSSGAGVKAVLTADAGEDEGKRCAASSRIHIEGADGETTAAANVMVTLHGYIRKLNTPL